MSSVHEFAKKNVRSGHYSKGTRVMYKNIIATFPTNCQKKDQKTGFDVSININL